MNDDAKSELLRGAEAMRGAKARAFEEELLKQPCYMCRRTPDEVKKYFYHEYIPEEDGPLMYIKDSRDAYVPICKACKGLVEQIALEDNNTWMDEYIEDRTYNLLCDIIDALEHKKKELETSMKQS